MTSRGLAWAGAVTMIVGRCSVDRADRGAVRRGAGRRRPAGTRRAGRAAGTGADQAWRGMSAGDDRIPRRALRQAGGSAAEHRRLPAEVDGRRRPAPGAAREVPGDRHPQPHHGHARQHRAVDQGDGQPEHPRPEQPVGRQRRSAEALGRDHPQQPLRGSVPAVRQRRLGRCGRSGMEGARGRAGRRRRQERRDRPEGVQEPRPERPQGRRLAAEGGRPRSRSGLAGLRAAEHPGADSRRRSGAVLVAGRLPQRALARAERVSRPRISAGPLSEPSSS